MAFGFDPSIILSGIPRPPAESSLNDTLQTLAGLQTHRAQLGDMLRKQQNEQTLADIYRQNAAGMPEGMPRNLAAAGFGPQAMAWQDQAAQMAQKETEDRKNRLDVETRYRRHIGEIMAPVKDQASLDAVRQEALNSGDPFLATYFKMKVPETYTPEAIQPIADQAISPEKRATIEAMAGRGPTVIGEDGTIYSRTGDTAKSVKDADTGKVIKAPPKRGGGKGGAGGPGTDLTPAALDAMAQKFNTTGELTGLGSGASAMALKVRIMNRALELRPGTDLASAGAGYKSDAASLKKLQTQADAVDAFEATAEKNLDTFMELSKKLVDTGSPFLNVHAREWEENVAGNPEMAGISAARATAVNEIGKVLSGSTGAGGLTEGARHEVEDLMKKGATIAQLRSAANVLKRDMHARKISVQEQLADIRGRISGKPAPTHAKDTSGAQTKAVDHYLVSPDKKQRVAVYSDGSKGEPEPNP